MKILLGQIVFLAALAGASMHLKQGGDSYYDAVALWIVFFGTIAVGLMTSPVFKWRMIVREIAFAFKDAGSLRQLAVSDALETLRGKESHLGSASLDHRLQRDGLELVKLGFSDKKIETILEQRAFNLLRDGNSIANWIRGLAKYPPAFGLIGTILGLINLMRGLSEGADPKQTGLSMAIALVATLYGLVTANLVVNPLGERLKKNLEEKEILAQLAIETVLMKKKNINMLEAQEALNGFIGLGGQELHDEFLTGEASA